MKAGDPVLQDGGVRREHNPVHKGGPLPARKVLTEVGDIDEPLTIPPSLSSSTSERTMNSRPRWLGELKQPSGRG